MKKGLLTAALALTSCLAQAIAVTDTVSVGATTANNISYPNQVWYSLPNDVQGSRDRTDWDVAFDLKNITSGVIINSPSGVTLWKYPKGNLATGWATADTAGLSTWAPHANSDTSWALGAIGRYADPASQVNLDWGTYNMTTHVVTGDSLYIIKLGNGQYKKFAVESLISGVYTFKFANMDGSSAQTQTITKSNYTGKTFAYVNLTSNTIIDREPLAANWDLLFTQYSASILPGGYTVTGVLLNQGVTAVKVSGLADKNTYVNYSAHTFSTQMNTIGYDWKSFTGSAYVLKDSQLYFVRRTNGDIWKVIFTGFGGAATGNFIFSKERIYTAPNSIPQVTAGATVTLYPNPSRGQHVHVLYDLNQAANDAKLAVYDLSGRTVHSAALENNTGMHQYELSTASFPAGMYIISVETGAGRVQQKLIVQ